jgi:hypothetical protein
LFSCINRNLTVIMVRIRYGNLGILGHSLRNKVPLASNQGESEVSSTEGWERTVNYVP